MDIVKTSIVVTKTIRNVGRLREIVVIFARNGFAEFITRGISSKIPNFVLPRSTILLKKDRLSRGAEDLGQVVGYRLRKTFEELGPVFIKFGQLLSTRIDIFDKSFIREMSYRRDKVKPIAYEDGIKCIEKSLGKKIDEVFERIDTQPIGHASIGVVYSGVLKTGEEVVIKVRRPNIIKQIENDVSVILFLSGQLEKISDEIKILGIKRVVEDFAASLHSEVNFNIEAMNGKRLKENIIEHDDEEIIYIPTVFDDFSSEDLLVIERINGIAFSDQNKIIEKKDEVHPKIEKAVSIFVRTFLQDGFFHADLHGGNLFYLDNGQIALIDFGLMGSLGKKSRLNFSSIIYSITTYNYEHLIYEFLDVAEYETIPDVDELIGEVRLALSPYMGLTVSQINFSQVMQIIIKSLTKHELYLPREWFIVFRALFTLDGVAKSIGFDINVYELLDTDIRGILKQSLDVDDLLEEGLWASKDVISSVRIIPRHIKWFLKIWSKNGYVFDINHKNLDVNADKLFVGLVFLALCIVSSVFIISGVLSTDAVLIENWREINALSWIFWAIGIFILFMSLRFIKKNRVKW